MERQKMVGFVMATVFFGTVFFQFVHAKETEDNITEQWTPELHMQYKTIYSTAMSPDGRRIAYVVRGPVMEGEKSEYLSHVWLVSSDGSSNFQYTQGEKSCSNPLFSPDGNYLAFTSSRSGENQVWIMRVLGGEAEQVTGAEAGVASYKWSPDSRWIVYTMRDPETKAEKNKKKEKRDVILADQEFKYNHLYVIPIAKDKDGKRTSRRLTRGDFHITSFNWSSDGKTIVFAHQPDPRINTGFSESDLSTVPKDSGAVVLLVQQPGVDDDPVYSPDGKWIAFTSQGGKREPIGLRDLYIVPALGGSPKKLAETPDRNARIIGWSNDGKWIYVSESVRTSQHVLAVPIDGKIFYTVTSGYGMFESVAFDKKTQKMAFVYENDDTPADVRVSPVSRFKMTQLTHLHKNVPMPAMGRTEVIRWISKDGMEIEGLITYPVNYIKGRSYPLIVEIHGGPAGVFGHNFTGGPDIYMTQYFAQNGYALLRPNPRGSTGYGKDFRYANFKDWGFGDFEDIVAGVDKVIDMGVGNPDSLCVMGWSYGGYMTSFVVTQTDRFNAASMGAGLPNLISMITTTDIPDYLVAHMGGEFWEDYATYEKHSAIYRIENVKTPTQVIHGANDLRVPFTQGQEFYVALKRRGVPTEMVVYPRTPHVPLEPKFLMDVSKRVMAWFEKQLRGREISFEVEEREGKEEEENK